MHLFPPFLEDHHYRLQAKRESGGRESEGEKREREREMLLSRSAQQFSSNTMNLDGQISKGVLSCSDRQAAYCKHVYKQMPGAVQDFTFQVCLTSQSVVHRSFTEALFVEYPHMPVSIGKDLSFIWLNLPTLPYDNHYNTL